MNTNIKTVVFWVVLVCTAALLFVTIRTSPQIPRLTYSEFLRQLESGEIHTALIEGGGSAPSRARLVLKNGTTVRTVLPPDYRDALAGLQQKGVSIEIRESSTPGMLLNALPFFVLLVLWFIMWARLRARGASI